MSWQKYHQESETLAAKAHTLRREGRTEDAKKQFSLAGAQEAKALDYLDSSKPRTYGITAVSATALFYKAGETSVAQSLAMQSLEQPFLPNFARNELRSMLQSIWNEDVQKESASRFSEGQITVSVSGEKILTGGAPLELILEKVQAVQSMYFRTVEFLQNLPLRKKGPPSKQLLSRYRPWLFQTVPGSYQFVVAIEQPQQGELFETGEIDPSVVSRTFMSVVSAISHDSEAELAAILPDKDYRSAFLKLGRNLAPNGKSAERITIQSYQSAEPVALTASNRQQISTNLRESANSKSFASKPPFEIKGVLRAVNLEKDWLEVIEDQPIRTIKITGLEEIFDDLIGPMVNKRVKLSVEHNGSKLRLIDIEQSDE